MIQGSPEWYASRTGVINASEIHAVLARNKDKAALCVVEPDGSIVERLGNGATAEAKAAKARASGKTVELVTIERGERSQSFYTLRNKIATEIIIGKSTESGYTSRDMQLGKEREPLAVMAWEALTGDLVSTTGGVFHERLPYVRCSPDGLASDRGLEVKCVKPETHSETIAAGAVPDEHLGQIHAGMWICKKPKWDFVSFCPEFPPELQLFVRTVEIDYSIQREMEIGCRELWAEVQLWVEKIRRNGGRHF